MPRGGARPNSGPKTKEEKLRDAVAASKSLASWFTQDYQAAKWKALLNSQDESVQMRAMGYLSDRLYGKAAQSMRIEGEMSVEVVKRVVADL